MAQATASKTRGERIRICRETIAFLRSSDVLQSSPAGERYPYITTCDICGKSTGAASWVTDEAKVCQTCIAKHLGRATTTAS